MEPSWPPPTAATTWDDQTIPTGTFALDGVSCSSGSDCTAVGQTPAATGVILATTDGGTTWTDQVILAGTVILDGVACTPADCLAVGNGGTLNGTTILRN